MLQARPAHRLLQPRLDRLLHGKVDPDPVDERVLVLVGHLLRQDSRLVLLPPRLPILLHPHSHHDSHHLVFHLDHDTQLLHPVTLQADPGILGAGYPRRHVFHQRACLLPRHRCHPLLDGFHHPGSPHIRSLENEAPVWPKDCRRRPLCHRISVRLLRPCFCLISQPPQLAHLCCPRVGIASIFQIVESQNYDPHELPYDLALCMVWAGVELHLAVFIGTWEETPP